MVSDLMYIPLYIVPQVLIQVPIQKFKMFRADSVNTYFYNKVGGLNFDSAD